jgi:hypothetical protein
MPICCRVSIVASMVLEKWALGYERVLHEWPAYRRETCRMDHPEAPNSARDERHPARREQACGLFDSKDHSHAPPSDSKSRPPPGSVSAMVGCQTSMLPSSIYFGCDEGCDDVVVARCHAMRLLYHRSGSSSIPRATTFAQKP